MLRLPRSSLRASVRAAAVAVLAVAALLPAFLSAPAAAARGADDSGSRHGVRLASPAVVRIVSVVQGQVVCKGCRSDGSDTVFPLGGGAYTIGVTGSGAFVSPDGYILTADHVVDLQNNPEVQQAFLTAAIDELAKTAGITTGDAQNIIQSLVNNGDIQVPTQVTSQRAFLSTAYTGQLQNPAQVTSYAVTRIVTSSPQDKQDTAVVKVEAHDVPFLQLAPASSVHVQDSVTAVAYPGDADTGDFGSLFSPTQSDVNTINGLLSASVNTGQVTAQKTLSDGTLVYETNGIANHGSSGGPVIDDQGRIVGFVDAGTSDARVVYLIPSDIAGEYVKEAGITSPSGAFMTQWTKAIGEYDATGACHFTNASKDLTTLQGQYPNFGGVQQFLSDAKAKATPAECPAPSGGATGLFIGGGAALAAILGGGLALFLVLRRKRQPAVQPAYGYPSAPMAPSAYHSYQPPASAQAMPTLPPTGAVPTPNGQAGMPAQPGAPYAPASWPPANGYSTPVPQQGYSAPSQPQHGYPTPAQPAYPAQQQPAYPAPAQPAYPTPAQPVYPTPAPPAPAAPVHPTPVPAGFPTPAPSAPAQPAPELPSGGPPHVKPQV